MSDIRWYSFGPKVYLSVKGVDMNDVTSCVVYSKPITALTWTEIPSSLVGPERGRELLIERPGRPEEMYFYIVCTMADGTTVRAPSTYDLYVIL